MRRPFMLLFALTLFLAACSGSGTVATDSAQDGGPLSPPTTVVGRLFLGTDISGASFRIEGLDGSVLATGTTGPNGHVFFENLSLPANFRAIALVPGSDVPFSAQLRGFDPTNRQVHISILSTLASEVMQARPELSLTQAEGLVKRALRLPDTLQLGLSLGEPNPVFSSIAFWRETASNGGWNAYKQELLVLFDNLEAQKGESPIHFWLSLDQLDRPITGLEPGLSAVAEQARLRLAERYRVKQVSGAAAQVRYGPPLILISGPASLGGQFLLGVTTGVAGNVLTAGINGLLGWAANQMGLSYGTSGQLQEISEQLTAVEGALTQLNSEITDANVINKITSLEAEFNPVLEITSTGQGAGATSSLIDSIVSTLTAIQEGTLVLNTPQAVDISDLINILETPDYPTILGDAEQQLPGSAGILAGVQGIVLNQQLGLDQPANFQRFPWRHNRVLDRVLPVFQKFSTLQSATLNLEAEVSHNYLKYPDPVDGINAATPDFVANIASQKTQQQMLPFRSGLEGITTDHEYGVMWFDTVFHPVSYDSANSAATTANEQVILCDSTVLVYSDWRLPTYGEYQALQARGTYNPTYSQTTDLDRDGNTNNDPDDDVPVNSHDSYPDTGQSTAGLPGLGFYNVANALNAAPNDNGSNGDLWMSYYYAEYSAAEWLTYHDSSYEFRLNHGSSNTSKESKSSDTNCYVMCRTFGPNVTVNPYASIVDQTNSAPDGPPTPSEVVGQAFQPAEYGQYGIPTSIGFIEPVAAKPVSIVVSSTGGSQTFTPPPGSLQFQAQVTYTIHIGGDFTIGYGTGSTRSVTTPATSSSGTVWSYFESSGASYNGVKEMINWSVANVDAGDLTPNATMLNAPYIGGILTPLASGSVVVTARLLGGDLQAVSGSQTYTVSPAPRTLTGLQITPRNQLYGATQSQPAQGSYPYHCTGFYSDGTVESLAGLVTWSVTPTPNAANAQFVGSTLEMSQPGQANPVSYNLTITASYQGQTDSTTIQIQPPVSSP